MWAKNHESCVSCFTTEKKHVGRGFCSKCYQDWYRTTPNGIERLRAGGRRWYDKSGGKVWSRVQREQRYFSGNREDALDRDRHRCTICGSDHQLVVHHRDGNGRGSKRQNDDIANLQTLCRACHVDVHRSDIQAGRKKPWSRISDCCIECECTHRKHGGNGLCTNCYARSLRKRKVQL